MIYIYIYKSGGVTYKRMVNIDGIGKKKQETN